MVMDFSVVVREKQHFGDDPDLYDDVEPGVPFVGNDKEYSFDTPSANVQSEAILLFQSFEVEYKFNPIIINGIQTSFIPKSSFTGTFVLRIWNANVLLIPPGILQSSATNKLRILSRDEAGDESDPLDDFILDNIIVLYRLDV